MDRESSLQIERALLEREDMTLINIEHKLLPELLPYYDVVLELKQCTLRPWSGRGPIRLRRFGGIEDQRGSCIFCNAPAVLF